MIEFFITLAWSCHNSAGHTRVGISFSWRRFIVPSPTPTVAFARGGAACWTGQLFLRSLFPAKGREIKRRSWSVEVEDSAPRRSWTSSTPCFTHQSGFLSCIFLMDFPQNPCSYLPWCWCLLFMVLWATLFSLFPVVFLGLDTTT